MYNSPQANPIQALRPGVVCIIASSSGTKATNSRGHQPVWPGMAKERRAAVAIAGRSNRPLPSILDIRFIGSDNPDSFDAPLVSPDDLERQRPLLYDYTDRWHFT